MFIRNSYINILLSIVSLLIISHLKSETEINEVINNFHSDKFHEIQNVIDDEFVHKEFIDDIEESNFSLLEMSFNNHDSNSSLSKMSFNDHDLSHFISILSHESNDLGK